MTGRVRQNPAPCSATTAGGSAASGSILAAGVSPGILAAGPSDAPAIVFVHSTRLTSAIWTAQLDGLGGEYRTIAIDLPGHGTRAVEPFSLAAATNVVSATIEEHAAGGRAIVVGLSLGGYVAMALAARDPARVRGLVLAGATAEPVGRRALPFLGLAAAMGRMDAKRFDRLSAWYFRTRYPAAMAEPIVAGGFWPDEGAAALRALVGERFVPRLAAYPGRTLIVNGEFDLVFRLSAPSFAAAAQDAQRVRIRGATHLVNLDRPAAFNEAVRRFARSLDPI